MSRRRTGIRPQDWYIEEPATHVARKVSGGAAIGGIFVVGRSTAQKHAEEVAAYKARQGESERVAGYDHGRRLHPLKQPRTAYQAAAREKAL